MKKQSYVNKHLRSIGVNKFGLVKCEYCKSEVRWFKTIQTPFSNKTVCLLCLGLDKVK